MLRRVYQRHHRSFSRGAGLGRARGRGTSATGSWRRTMPDVPRQSEHAAAAASRAWRWSGEMEEIAATFGAAGLPEGLHRAAADVYRRLESFKNRTAPPSMAEVTQAMQRSVPVEPASVTHDVNDRV